MAALTGIRVLEEAHIKIINQNGKVIFRWKLSPTINQLLRLTRTSVLLNVAAATAP